MNINILFHQALLAEVSYADFDIDDIVNADGSYIEKKVEATVTESLSKENSQADILSLYFTRHWEVISHQPDTLQSDFSATLFKNKHTNEYVFANRGTAGLFGDVLLADVFGIVLQGKATLQLIDMYRYFRKLETPKGQVVNYTTCGYLIGF